MSFGDWTLDSVGKFIVGPSLQQSPGSRFSDSAPLLEEEGNSCRAALFFDGQYPVLFHQARSGTTLATHNHPVDV